MLSEKAHTQTRQHDFTPVSRGVLQRKCTGGNHTVGSECESCGKKNLSLQRKTQDSVLRTQRSDDVPPIVHDVLRSPGQPLDAETRTFFETRFGHDFSRVRVHTDARAAESADMISALAYTAGQHVVFGTRQYSPATRAGRKLLAHELMHTIQQNLILKDSFDLSLAPASTQREHEADAMADAALLGSRLHPNPTPLRPMIQRQASSTDVELEVPTPKESERLRQLGVHLPKVSAPSADPRSNNDYVDRRLTAVGWGIYVFGAYLYVDGLPLPAFIPNTYIDLNLRRAVPINESVYPDREAALNDIPSGPLVSGEPVPYAYYRAVGGLIVPTIFSPATTPRTIETLTGAMRKLGEEVSRELVVLALSLVGGMLLRGIISRFVRVRETEVEERPPSGAVEDPVSFGKKVGEEVAPLKAGKRATIAKRMTQAKFLQSDAVEATGEASRVAFGRTGGTVSLPNGDKIVPSVIVGENQPVFVVKPDGRVLAAKATISKTEPLDLANPIRITNLRTE